MDIISVIYLGHKLNVPLMYRPSELSDGLEPTAIFSSEDQVCGSAGYRVVRCWGCTRGGAGWVLGGYYTGY